MAPRVLTTGAKVTFKAGSVLDLASIFGEQKFSSALDSALYHCLDDATNEKYLAALHKQVSLSCRWLCIPWLGRLLRM